MSNAILEAYDLVQARFSSEGVSAEFAFGWQAPAKHPRGPRVTWVPGDEGGAVGETTDEIEISTDVLARQWMLCRIYIEAPADATDPSNERKQLANTLALRKAVFRALKLDIGGWFRVEEERYADEISRRNHVAICLTIALADDIADDLLSAELLDVLRGATVHELLVDEENTFVVTPN